MKSIYKLLLIVLLTGFLAACKEDPIEVDAYGSLEGTLLDEETFEPIPDAIITTVPTTNVFISDEQGRFFIDSLAADNYTIRIKADGYREGLQNVEIEPDRTRQSTILMIAQPEESDVLSAPVEPQPLDGLEGLEVELSLSWSPGNTTQDTIYYDVLLYSEHDPEGRVVAEATTDTSVLLEDLNYGTTYFWQVRADNGEQEPVFGPVWKFSTKIFPDYRYHYVRADSITGELNVFTGQTGDFQGNSIEEIQLTSGMGDCWKPRMSPNREKVAFLSFSGTAPHLFVMDRDGSNVRQVTNEIPVMSYEIEQIDYAWSPNSGQLLFMNFDRAYKINADGTGMELFAQAPQNRAFTGFDWTAHSNHVAARVRGNNHYEDELYLINPAGTMNMLVADQPGTLGNPMFSVDGTAVLYTYDVSESQNANGRLIDAEIFIRSISTGSTLNLSGQKAAGTNDVQARYSSTGGRVIFTSMPNDGVGPSSIMSVKLDGTERRFLFEDASMADMR